MNEVTPDEETRQLFNALSQLVAGAAEPEQAAALLAQLESQLSRQQHACQSQIDQLRRQLEEETNRRRQAEALRARYEARYDFALGGSNSGVWEWLVQDGKIYFSPRWKEVLGYTDTELGQTVEEWALHIHPEDLPRVEAAMQPVLNGARPQIVTELRIRCRDGSYKWLESTGKIFTRTVDGRPERIIGLLTDITARKQAESQRQHQHELVQAFYETTLGLINRLALTELLQAILSRAGQLMDTPDGILYVLDAQQGVMTAQIASGMAQSWIGYQIPFDSNGLIGRVWRNKEPLVVRDDDAWQNRLSDLPATDHPSLLAVPIIIGAEVIGVLGLRRQAGCDFLADEIELLQQFGQLAALALHHAQLYTEAQQEVAERRRAEAALRSSEQRLLRLVEQLPAGALYLEGERLTLNRQAELITGYQRHEITTIGEWLHKLHPGQSHQLIDFYSAQSNDAAQPSTIQITRKDGINRLVECTVFAEDQTGVWLLRDVTDSERTTRLMAQAERTARVGGWELQIQSKQLYWTEGMYHILEVDPKHFALKSENVWAFQPQAAIEQIEAAIDRCLVAGEAVDVIVEQRTQRGRPIWTRMTASAACQDGQPVRLYGSLQDITAYKAVEAALRENELRFRQLTEHIDGVFWLTEADPNQLLYVSPAYERLWHRPASALQENPLDWLASIHPEDRERVYLAISNRQLSGEYDEEYRLLQPDGSVRWVRDRSFPIDDGTGRVYRIAGLTEDITDRKQTTEALRESEERFRQLAETINEAFWLADTNGVLYVSPAYEKILGKSADEFYREPWNWLSIVHPADQERIRLAALEKQWRGGYDEEYRIVRPGGEVRWIRDRAFPIDDGTGHVVRIAGLAEDITAQKLQAEAMERLIACSQATGHAFLTASVETLAYVLGVRHVLLCELPNGDLSRARTIAAWRDGLLTESGDYQLVSAPFIQTLEQGIYFQQCDAQQHFPQDPLLAELKAASFLGALLRSASGAPIGLLSAINDQPIDEQRAPAAILAIFAGRAATELERQQAEWELQRQRNEFQQMLDAVNALVWRLDSAGRVVHANQLAQQLAVTPKQIAGKRLAELFPHDPDARRLDEANLKVIASGQPQLGQIVEWRVYETMRWSSVDQIPLRDADGQVDGLLVFVYGITELKEAEQQIKELNAQLERRVQERTAALATANMALRRSEQQLRQIIDLVPHRIYVKDNEGRFLLANQAVADYFGVAVEAVLGKTSVELGTPAHRVEDEGAEDQALQQSSRPRASHLQHTVDLEGREQILYTTIVPFTFFGDETPATVGISIDLTEQKRVEEELRRSEARQRALLAAIPDMVFRIRRDGVFLDYWTPSSGGTLIPPESIRGTNIRSLPLPPQVIDESLAANEHAIVTGITQTVEYFVDGPDGREYYESRIVRSGPDEVVSIVRNITERVKSAAALRASEEKFSKLFYTSPLPMLITHLSSGRYLDVNDRCLELLGRSREEVIGRTARELDTWLQLADRKRFTRQLRKEGVVRNLEMTFRIHPGDVREMLISAAIIQIEGEECIFWAATDITERKRIDQALRLSEQRLRQIIDLVPHLIYAKDVEGRFVLVNQASADLYHTTPDELLGKTDAEFARSAEEVEQFRRADLEVLANGSIKLIPEEPITDASGRTRLLRTVKIPFTFSGTGTPAVLGVSTDVTELKEAETALRESEARFRQFTEHMPFIVWMLSSDGQRFVYRNSAFELITGRSIDSRDSIVVSWLDILHPADLEQVLNFLNRLQQLEPQQMEFRILRPSGEERWLSVRYFPVRNKAGELALHTGIAEDITERKAAEAQIHQLNEQLEERVRQRTAELEVANRELESFSYSVSHDLRAPLRAINGFSQALFEDYSHLFDAEGLNYLERVRAASQRMAMLIDDLLTLSRVTRQEIRRGPLNLSALATAVAEELQATQPERQVEFIIAPDLWAEADPNLIYIVMDNLLHNAWKYTSKHPQARIEFGVLASAGSPIYFVKDDGAGFDMAYAAKLFGAFQRLHRDIEFEGTGVGLATVQRIIHRHGGRTWAEGAVEQGATFYFTLPL
jgi:PAS domain S-box-containing protein